MKTKIFILLALAAVCLSCDKDDKVDLDRIEGAWYWDTTYPHLVMDMSMTYTFYENGTYRKTVDGFGTSPTITEGEYVISITGKPRVLTLYADGRQSPSAADEQFHILKLTGKEMMLENTSKDASFPEMRLLRASTLYD